MASVSPYHRPPDVATAWTLLRGRRATHVRLLAGGTDLVVSCPPGGATLVDLQAADLRGIDVGADGSLRVGAMDDLHRPARAPRGGGPRRRGARRRCSARSARCCTATARRSAGTSPARGCPTWCRCSSRSTRGGATTPAPRRCRPSRTTTIGRTATRAHGGPDPRGLPTGFRRGVRPLHPGGVRPRPGQRLRVRRDGQRRRLAGRDREDRGRRDRRARAPGAGRGGGAAGPGPHADAIADATTATRDTVDVRARGAAGSDYRRHLAGVAVSRCLATVQARLAGAAAGAGDDAGEDGMPA
jgi:hypothetical protein